MSHWTKELRAENERLKKALDEAITALAVIPQTRLDKYVGAGEGEHAMAYRKAVGEIALRNREAISRARDLEMGVEH